MKLMSRYGIGDDQKFNFLLKPEAAANVQALGLKQCGDSYRNLCNVHILSKMGDHYFLQVGDKFHITVLKSDVVSIKRLDPSEITQPVEH